MDEIQNLFLSALRTGLRQEQVNWEQPMERSNGLRCFSWPRSIRCCR